MPDPTAEALLARLEELPAAEPLLRRLRDVAGVYLVGGAVRDLLLGGVPADLDLAVEDELGAVARLLGDVVREHGRFLTCTVLADGLRYDIAQARAERYERPGALPTVIGPATIEADLERRDFTVNAIALGIGGADRGRLVEVAGARDDLRRRLLRVLHEGSFVDDPTRLLRLARYGARLGFSVEPATGLLVADALATGALRTVSGERIGAELRLSAAERDPIAAFTVLAALGVDEAIAPGFGLAQPALAARALELLPPDGDPGAVVLALAVRGVELAARRRLLDELAFPAESRDRILAAAEGAGRLAPMMARADRPSEIAAAVGGRPVELVAVAGAIGAERQAARWLEDLRHVKLAIDGDDLLRAGVPAGPRIGAALAAALAARLDGLAGDRRAQLAVALRAAGARAGG